MQTNTLLRKGLTIAIILVLGTSIIPIVSSLPIQKHASIHSSIKELDSVTKTTNTGSQSFNITLTGTIGENGWYISDVIITITVYNGSEIEHIYYSFDNMTWTEFTAPITVNTDGSYHLYILIIDQNGNKHYYGPFNFKIDKTPPYVKITSPEPGFLYIAYKDIIFIKFPIFITTLIIGPINVSANATDNQSGVNRVEFFIDDNLQYNDTTAPYNWTWSGSGQPGHIFSRTLKVIAFDNAGNQNSDELTVWKIF